MAYEYIHKVVLEDEMLGETRFATIYEHAERGGAFEDQSPTYDLEIGSPEGRLQKWSVLIRVHQGSRTGGEMMSSELANEWDVHALVVAKIKEKHVVEFAQAISDSDGSSTFTAVTAEEKVTTQNSGTIE